MIASERERCACRRLTPHDRHIDAGRPGLDDFDGFAWAEWTSHHWEIPITACVVYLVGIFLLKRFMAERKPVRLQRIVLGWNFGLSAFSFAGMAYCVPHLLFGEHGVYNRGFTGAVCSH